MRCVSYCAAIDTADEVRSQANLEHDDQISLFLGEGAHLILTVEAAQAIVDELSRAIHETREAS